MESWRSEAHSIKATSAISFGSVQWEPKTTRPLPETTAGGTDCGIFWLDRESRAITRKLVELVFQLATLFECEARAPA